MEADSHSRCHGSFWSPSLYFDVTSFERYPRNLPYTSAQLSTPSPRLDDSLPDSLFLNKTELHLLLGLLCQISNVEQAYGSKEGKFLF